MQFLHHGHLCRAWAVPLPKTPDCGLGDTLTGAQLGIAHIALAR